MVELLSPVGDFECLKAAVQNGADAVYFGANLFSARAFASNFDLEMLEKAINYAKTRNVKTNLTLNTLIKNDEFQSAIDLATKAYEFGIDAIIVQDLGLALKLIKMFPKLHIHGSTQMTVHNLEGAKQLEKMGFKRAVLSRELSKKEIENICKNTNIEIEVFVHGALCISYSGQCLFSSIIGGRSGNRGKCAQPCRLSYELLEDENVLEKGHLLSPKDLYGLEDLPDLVNAGVKCLKIEGRMKTPEYVATVTRIYRKYLDLAEKGEIYQVDEQDKKDLMQVFNRGGFSKGHLENEPNTSLIYKQKPNNMGIPLGKILNFNQNKGHITFKTSDTVKVGDKISIEGKNKESNTYTISELMINDKNVKIANKNDKIKIGRMKGKIFVGDNIYKISDKDLTKNALESLEKENKKRKLKAILNVKENEPVSMKIIDEEENITVQMTSNMMPQKAINTPITEERLKEQISKTVSTPFIFENIEIDLGEGLYIPSISKINELRRETLSQYEDKLINSFKRQVEKKEQINFEIDTSNIVLKKKKVSLLLNILNNALDYTKIENIDKIYIPLKYFLNTKYQGKVKEITNKFNTYIYMPIVLRENYQKQFLTNIENILNVYQIKGFVISNIGNFELIKKYSNTYEIITNYTMNVFNNVSIENLDANVVTLSPELNKKDLLNIVQVLQKEKSKIQTELIVYGKTPLMNTNYCLLGRTNKCYKECERKCMLNKRYELRDRLGLEFRIIPDNIETVTTIYNAKTTSIECKDIPIDIARIDVLDENIEKINEIIKVVRSGQKLEGKEYTNGNLNREV